MDYAVDFSSLMSQQVANLDLMVGSSKYHTSLLPDNPHVDHKIVLWVEEEFSCDALFAGNLCFNSDHILIF
jgi:hypothetical protein